MTKRIYKYILFLVFVAAVVSSSAYCADKTFEEIIAGVNDKFAQIETMTADVSRKSSRGETRLVEKWRYYYKKPDMFRVDYIEPHKRFLVLNRDELIEYIPEVKKARVISLTGMNDSEKTALYTSAFKRVAILGINLGYIPKGNVKIKRVTLGDYDADFLESKSPDYQIWTEVKSGALLKHVVYEDGKPVYTTTGNDFKRFSDGIMLPQKIELTLPDEADSGSVVKSTMILNELKINDGISDSIFDYKLPDGIQIIK